MTSTSDMLRRQPFEEKALEYFAEVIINKSLIHEAGFGARAIPTYVGDLYYVPPDGDERKKGEVWMRNFKPFQVGALDIDYYVECRQYFTLDEWRNLLISSMGFNPSIYTERQKMLLVTRMLPFIESR